MVIGKEQYTMILYRNITFFGKPNQFNKDLHRNVGVFLCPIMITCPVGCGLLVARADNNRAC